MKRTVKKTKNAQRVYLPIEIKKWSYQKMLPLLEQCAKEMNEAAKMIQATQDVFPEGRLRVSPHRGSYQYYHISEKSEQVASKGTYIPKERMDLARGLAQKLYNKVVAEAFERGAKAMKDALLKFNYLEIENCFDVQGVGRWPLIAPVYLPNDVYADRWQQVEYQGQCFEENEAVLITAKGERVRSKSEVIIANMLNQLGVPYRYEYPLRMSSGRVVYPDFTCLNVRTRDEFIWEHFGRMNDAEYQVKTFKKLDGFALDGYIHGVNFIYTMENDLRPMNPKYVELLVRTFLL